MGFPRTRMRRLRRTRAIREMCGETRLSRNDLIMPLFALPGEDREEEVDSLPGVYRHSVDRLQQRCRSLNPPAALLFGVPDEDAKDARASSALDADGIVPRALRAMRSQREDLCLITDLCLCAYTDHGHCGMLTDSGEVDNDATLELLGRMAQVHAEAGADIVAPSGMMDGQVRAIRAALDEAGHEDVGIMSYAAKFCSSFYGPFRDAAHSAPDFGDRSGYQLAPANRREAIRDALLDEEEGADWLMVKPGMPYLDVLADLRRETRLPLSVYHVSGEYAMLTSAAEKGRINERETVLESLLSMKRAGADAIITYYADRACGWLEG